MVPCDVAQICNMTHRIGDVCTGQEKVHVRHLSANVAVDMCARTHRHVMYLL